MTKEHTPTPWVLDECCYGDNIIEGPNDEIIMWDTPAHKITPTLNDMLHIVKCVNMHDELVEALQIAREELKDYETALNGEDYNNPSLNETLKKAGAI